MPTGLKRYQKTDQFHFLTFSCYHRQPFLSDPKSKDIFEIELEKVRKRYGLVVAGYVVMPEHVHLLVDEPCRGTLATALQVLKQVTSRRLKPASCKQFWQTRYYDFNVSTKLTEKLRYIHRNPVKRGLAAQPEDYQWSSFDHYATGKIGIVEIESEWTARRREKAVVDTVKKK